MDQPKRPLSPHLQIYRRQITSVMSIFHRITGIMLMSAPVMVVFALAIAAKGQDCYAELWNLALHPVGQIYLIGLCFAFYFHTFHGLRHLFWDSGIGFDMNTVRWTGWLAVIMTVVMTFFTLAFLRGW